jgi:hypothetical protein
LISGDSIDPIRIDHLISRGPVDVGVDDLLSVAHDSNIGAVRDHDDLAASLDVLDNSVIRRAKLTPRIASSENVTQMAPLAVTIRR